MYELFKSLRKEELPEFKAYLNSPYLNSSEVIKEIFKILLRYYPEFDPIKINYSILSRMKVIDKFYGESEIRAYISKLNRKLLEFLSIKKFNESDFLKDELLMDVLSERGLKKQFLNIHSEYCDKLKNYGIEFGNPRKEYKAASRYFDFSESYFSVLKKSDADKQISIIEKCRRLSAEEFFIKIIADNITYLIYVPEFGNVNREDLKTDKNIINFIYDNLNIEEKTPLVILYKRLFDLFYFLSGSVHYLGYRDYFIKLSPELNIKERSYHYKNLFIFCSLMRKSGLSLTLSNKPDKNAAKNFPEINFKRESFKLMKYFLESGLYKEGEDKFISSVIILNILKLADRKKDISLVEKFIEIHREDFKSGELNSLIVFARIYKNVYGRNYNTAFADLVNIELSNIIFKYEMRILRMRLLYEKNEIENLIDDINSAREYIKRDKFLSEVHKIRENNFIKFLEVLCTKNTIRELKKSTALLIKEHEILNKEWLIDKYKIKLKID